MIRTGVGYRYPLAAWIDAVPDVIDCVEIIAEHFFEDSGKLLELRKNYPLMVHGLGLSLGTPGEIDKKYLDSFVAVCDEAQPIWVSEHIAFTRTADVDLGHLNPIPYTQDSLNCCIEHAKQIKNACGRPLLLENITSHLQLPGEMPETEFINQLCCQAECGLLLDVTNLYVNSRNHNYDAGEWLLAVQPEYIKQLHIVGFGYQEGSWLDNHANDIQAELFELTSDVIAHSNVDTIIIERDAQFPPVAQLQNELVQLKACYAQ